MHLTMHCVVGKGAGSWDVDDIEQLYVKGSAYGDGGMLFMLLYWGSGRCARADLDRKVQR